VRGILVVLHLRQLQQLAGAGQALLDVTDAVDRLVQQGTLAAQLLRVLGVVPDVRIFQLAVYFFQAFALGIVVKDTPGARPACPAGRRCAGGWD